MSVMRDRDVEDTPNRDARGTTQTMHAKGMQRTPS